MSLDPTEKARRLNRVEVAPRKLKEHGIEFESCNNGQHLIVYGFDCYIDFWPGTERWTTRFGRKAWGLQKLIAFVRGEFE